jgi:hypothetical protein
VPLVLAHDVDAMGGGVEGADGPAPGDADGHGALLERLAGELLRVERIAVLDQSRVALEHLAVGQRDATLAASRDREDPRLEHARSDVLEQRRVAHGPDDVLVDLPRLVLLEELARHLLAVHVHGEAAHGGVVRKREDVRALDGPAVRVHEHLVDVRHRDLVADLHVHAVVLHGQRHVAHLRPLRRMWPDDDESVGPRRHGEKAQKQAGEKGAPRRSHGSPPDPEAGSASCPPLIRPAAAPGSRFPRRRPVRLSRIPGLASRTASSG